MIEIDTTQLLAVMILGFVLGGVALQYFLKRPVSFALVCGVLFFIMRFIPAFFSLGGVSVGVIPGNGIVGGGVLWIIFIAMMILGDLVMKRRWYQYEDRPEVDLQ